MVSFAIHRLWDSSARDLNSFGLDKFDRNYCNGGAKRSSTSRLQLALLKAALLLGVQVTVASIDSLHELHGYQVVIVASGAKSKGTVLNGLGFTLGPKNADSQCIAVVAHFEFTGPWKTLADEINWYVRVIQDIAIYLKDIFCTGARHWLA